MDAHAGRLRFPGKARLKTSTQFGAVKHRGVSYHGKFMVLSVLKDVGVEAAQLGIITSRRVGCAVDRNRVRRRLREILRADRAKLQGAPWLVLIARQKATGATFEELRREWRGLASRAGVLLCEP